MTNIQPEGKVRGVISGELTMTEDKGCIFVELPIVVVFHMICTMGMSY